MLRAVLISTVVACALGAPALAQLPDPGAPPVQPPDGAVETPDTAGPDLTALRYYIDQGDWARVEAELRRLRADYPNWEPPENLLSGEGPAVTVDVQPLWDLFAAGQYAEVRARLAELEQQYPDFVPPEDLMRELNLAEARQRLVNASDQAQWQRVIDIARQLPSLLTCARVDNVWRTAEAYAELGEVDNALAMWRTVLQTCTNLEEQVATLQKADEYVSVEQLEGLVETAIASTPQGEERFLEVRSELLAGRGLDGGEPDGSVVTADTSGSPSVSLPQPTPITPSAGQSAAPAPSAPAGPSAAERAAQAQEMADYETCLRVTEGQSETGARLVRAWCLFELDRPTEANLLFQQVHDAASDTEMVRSSSFGLVLSLLRANRLAEAGVLMRQVSLTPDQRRDVEAEIMAQRAVTAFGAEQFREVIRLVEARRQLGVPDRRDLDIILAWSYYQTGQLSTAETMFERLDRVFSTSESREGLRVVRSARQPAN